MQSASVIYYPAVFYFSNAKLTLLVHTSCHNQYIFTEFYLQYRRLLLTDIKSLYTFFNLQRNNNVTCTFVQLTHVNDYN